MYKTGMIRLDGLVLDPSTQIRGDTSAATVRDYQMAMRAGAEFPAITVVPVDAEDEYRKALSDALAVYGYRAPGNFR